jgi:catechol-2,3-dioxygenase
MTEIVGRLAQSVAALQHIGLCAPAPDNTQEPARQACTYTRLKALDITPHFTVDHGMTTSFYYVDPDGNSVELQCDNMNCIVQIQKSSCVRRWKAARMRV